VNISGNLEKLFKRNIKSYVKKFQRTVILTAWLNKRTEI